jgi:hypothetical protein
MTRKSTVRIDEDVDHVHGFAEKGMNLMGEPRLTVRQRGGRIKLIGCNWLATGPIQQIHRETLRNMFLNTTSEISDL